MDEVEPGGMLSAQFGIVPAPQDLDASTQWQEFHAALKQRIEEMLEHDFHRLQSILYLMDVDEQMAEEAFSLRPPAAVANELASLMIKRHISRMKTRQERADSFDPE